MDNFTLRVISYRAVKIPRSVSTQLCSKEMLFNVQTILTIKKDCNVMIDYCLTAWLLNELGHGIELFWPRAKIPLN